MNNKNKKLTKNNKKKNIKKANKKTIKNRNLIIFLSISVLLVIIATFSITFAYFSLSAKQTNNNVVTTTCYELTFTESSSINLTSYPMSDDKGLSITPYTFSFKNTCQGNSNYQVILNIKNTTSASILPYINYSLDGTNAYLLSNATKITLPTGATSPSTSASYLIDSGTLIGTTNTKSYSLRLWIGEHGGNNLMGNNFEAEIMVYSSANGDPITLKETSITNLVPDASFEDGLWSSATLDSTYVKYGNKSMKITGLSSAPEITKVTNASIAINSTHKYYARYEIYHTGASGSVGLYWPIAEPNFFEGRALGTANNWNTISGVNTRSNFSQYSSAQLRLDYNNGNATTSVWYDGVMLIDLTAAFGSGLEPTASWCDANIPFFIGSKKLKYSSTSY